MTPAEQKIGQLLGGKYRLEALLALGGMGFVYGARHEATGRAVAVKLMRPELAGRPDLVRRVAAEARLAVEASHPNVVEVLDAGTDAHDVPYLVLERLYGQALDALLAEPLPVLAAMQTLMPVLNALCTLHRLGIVHRDLKPSNIFLSHDPDGRVTPKLLDFGIAKALETAGTTRSGTALGTPAYMAPEQALGCASLGPFTDIWSLGVVLVRCLTGRLPYEDLAGTGFGSLRSGLRAVDLEGVPAPLAPVLARALQLEPAERPPSVAAFRGALLDALHKLDADQSWPDETTISYAPHEFALTAALARAERGVASRSLSEPKTTKARVRIRRAQTRTLAQRVPHSRSAARVKKLGLPLLLLLPLASTVVFVGRPRPDPAPVTPVSTAPITNVAAPDNQQLRGGPIDAPAPALLEVPSDARLPAPPSRSQKTALRGRSAAVEENRARPVAAPKGDSATPAELRSSDPAELSEPKAPSTQVQPRIGANRSPIIEWTAQN